MNIGIIGSGNIGGNLGKVWAEKGHAILYGARDPNSPKTRQALAQIGQPARVGTLAEAAAFGEVIVLAVPSAALHEVVPALGDLSGKIVIDTTNRLTLVTGDTSSPAEEVARLAPGARVVKAYNTMGAETLLNPVFDGVPASAFLCGDDPDAKAVVARLTEEIGLRAADAGPLSNAPLVESLAKLWIAMMRGGQGRDFAFTLVRR